MNCEESIIYFQQVKKHFTNRVINALWREEGRWPSWFTSSLTPSFLPSDIPLASFTKRLLTRSCGCSMRLRHGQGQPLTMRRPVVRSKIIKCRRAFFFPLNFPFLRLLSLFYKHNILVSRKSHTSTHLLFPAFGILILPFWTLFDDTDLGGLALSLRPQSLYFRLTLFWWQM